MFGLISIDPLPTLRAIKNSSISVGAAAMGTYLGYKIYGTAKKAARAVHRGSQNLTLASKTIKQGENVIFSGEEAEKFMTAFYADDILFDARGNLKTEEQRAGLQYKPFREFETSYSQSLKYEMMQIIGGADEINYQIEKARNLKNRSGIKGFFTNWYYARQEKSYKAELDKKYTDGKHISRLSDIKGRYNPETGNYEVVANIARKTSKDKLFFQEAFKAAHGVTMYKMANRNAKLVAASNEIISKDMEHKKVEHQKYLEAKKQKEQNQLKTQSKAVELEQDRVVAIGIYGPRALANAQNRVLSPEELQKEKKLVADLYKRLEKETSTLTMKGRKNRISSVEVDETGRIIIIANASTKNPAYIVEKYNQIIQKDARNYPGFYQGYELTDDIKAKILKDNGVMIEAEEAPVISMITPLVVEIKEESKITVKPGISDVIENIPTKSIEEIKNKKPEHVLHKHDKIEVGTYYVKNYDDLLDEVKILQGNLLKLEKSNRIAGQKQRISDLTIDGEGKVYVVLAKDTHKEAAYFCELFNQVVDQRHEEINKDIITNHAPKGDYLYLGKATIAGDAKNPVLTDDQMKSLKAGLKEMEAKFIDRTKAGPMTKNRTRIKSLGVNKHGEIYACMAKDTSADSAFFRRKFEKTVNEYNLSVSAKESSSKKTVGLAGIAGIAFEAATDGVGMMMASADIAALSEGASALMTSTAELGIGGIAAVSLAMAAKKGAGYWRTKIGASTIETLDHGSKVLEEKKQSAVKVVSV